MDLGLRERVCLVTGSTSGIGLETARLLAAEGARVVVCGRDADRVARAKTDVAAEHGVAVDLSAPEAPAELFAEIGRSMGEVQCLVNNVGAAYQAQFDQLSDGQWDEMWQLNVMSYVRCIREALPAMRSAKAGAIVNVASTAAKRPSTGMPNYSVTKAAVMVQLGIAEVLKGQMADTFQRGFHIHRAGTDLFQQTAKLLLIHLN